MEHLSLMVFQRRRYHTLTLDRPNLSLNGFSLPNKSQNHLVIHDIFPSFTQRIEERIVGGIAEESNGSAFSSASITLLLRVNKCLLTED
ncbi:hypothetical protein NPIL_612811 [Nephila pilipes]|uniref:Uncharacterized protein n=1 Tax=Nephila pilipes TaxID=299642 RepID=A0A8X6NNQ0_NEPPI|nr:hypothetical protein NPIL_612811 [Nephila pilipes]